MAIDKARIQKIVKGFTDSYFDSVNQEMYPDGQKQYYQEQEQTYTDLSQLDSQHSENTFKERNKFVYPEQEWTNPFWAEGDFQNGYKSDFFNFENYSPNTNDSLFDALRVVDSSIIPNLNNRTASIDAFLSNPDVVIKISSIMDLTDFMKVSDDTLVHKSKQDLWKMLKDKEGNVYIKRLFDDNNLIKE